MVGDEDVVRKAKECALSSSVMWFCLHVLAVGFLESCPPGSQRDRRIRTTVRLSDPSRRWWHYYLRLEMDIKKYIFLFFHFCSLLY
jgi:hypothetical protein